MYVCDDLDDRILREPNPDALTGLDRFDFLKKLPVPFLKEQGVSDTPNGSIRFNYGSGARARIRRSPNTAHPTTWEKNSDLPNRAFTQKGTKATSDTLLIVEGESDALTAWWHSLPAIGVPGATMAKVIEPHDIVGYDRIIFLREPDAGGDAFVQQVPARLFELGFDGEISWITLSPFKDLNELHCAVPCHDEFLRHLYSAISHAVTIERPDPRPSLESTINLEHLTEIDAAHALVDLHGQDIRYCEKAGGWHLWDGKRWKRDEDASINRLAEDCTTKIADAANAKTDLEERKRLLLFALSLRKRRTLENMVAATAWQPQIAIGDPTRFDANPWLLNVANGTIDLRTGQLSEHQREALITKNVPIRYDSDAQCPRWLQFLEEIFAGDQETIDFVQRAVGYSLTGENREHCCFVLWGTGANGKSTFIKVLEKLLGDYGKSAAPATFVDRQAGGATNDLAALRGARLVSSMETSDRAALAENFLKATTGGDKLSARFLYAEYFDFEPCFKLWIATNNRPVVRGTDEGIWRRIKLVPFTERFDGNRRDELLSAKLETELSGILSWAIRGCSDWQSLGLGQSESVTQATQTYRSDMDTLAQFLAEECEIEASVKVRAKDLYAAYRAWAEEAGEKPLSQKWLGLRLKDRGFSKKDTMGYPYYLGICLSSVDHCGLQ